MSTSVRAAMTRLFILLLLVCAGTYAWETSRNSEMQPVAGQVISTVYKGYRIGYELQGQNYQFATRTGIVDSMGALRTLAPGATIPLLANPAKQHDPLINTLNGRYALTLNFAVLLLLFALIVLVSTIKSGGGRAPQ